MKRNFLNSRSLKELRAIAKELHYSNVNKIDDKEVLIKMLSGHTDKVLLKKYKL